MGVCDCLVSLLKCGISLALVIVNAVVMVVGLVLVGICAFVVVAYQQENPDRDVEPIADEIIIALATVTSLGALLAIIGFCGFCGACCRSSCSCMLKGYAVLQIVLLVAIAVALGFSLSKVDNIKENWNVEVQDKYSVDLNVTTKWNKLMKKHECCGVYSYNDWKTSEYYATANEPVPEECCATTSKNATYAEYVNTTECRRLATTGTTDDNNGYLHTRGCSSAILLTSTVAVTVVSAVLIAFLLVSSILACFIIKRNKSDNNGTYNDSVM